MKFSDKIRTLRTEQNKTQKETAEYPEFATCKKIFLNQAKKIRNLLDFF